MNFRVHAIVLLAALLTLSNTLPPFITASFAAGRDNEPNGQTKETFTGRYPLEQTMEVDHSVQTWLYVFSALMLLFIGWLCFKPTRVERMKLRRPPGSKKADSGKKGAQQTRK